MNLVALQRKHVPAIVEVHREALAGDFLPSLGPAFLTSLYEGMLELELAFGFVANEEDQVAGFVIATEDSRALFRRILARRFFIFAVRAAAAVLSRPRLIVPTIETFLYPSKEGVESPAAELLVIAVRSQDRHKGVGAALVHALDMSMRERLVARYKVTTLASNVAAQRFYLRLGFKAAGGFTMYRKPWCMLMRSIA